MGAAGSLHTAANYIILMPPTTMLIIMMRVLRVELIIFNDYLGGSSFRPRPKIKMLKY